MEKYIKRISGIIPNTLKEIDINLDGKNLILTGTNGSGKTSLLRELFRKIDILIVQKQMADLPRIWKEYDNSIRHWKDNTTKGTSTYQQYESHIKNLKQSLDKITQGLQLDIPENIDFSSKYDDKLAIVKIFEATRIAKISHADTARGLVTEQKDKASANTNNSLGNNLEQHLVNLKNRSSLAITEDKDEAFSEKINNWFFRFEKNLKLLMEDNSTVLKFDSNTLKFSIHQDNKPPYTFQTLSSGYLAIFDIYADLLMRTEYFDITPDELVGTVFIDEIDAHLHVSLQRIILTFLIDSFPKIQFIVTTHSPFVLMSVNNAVIFDISRNEQVDEDLSLYSYSAVMEGLLGTKTTSLLLDDLIMEISNLVNSEGKDYAKLRHLVDKIKPLESKLDSRSKAFYLLGVNALLDMEQ